MWYNYVMTEVLMSVGRAMLLVLASTEILGSESRLAHGHILLSRDFGICANYGVD
jgi:hypothetical protein